jgi:fatty acid desaturase
MASHVASCVPARRSSSPGERRSAARAGVRKRGTWIARLETRVDTTSDTASGVGPPGLTRHAPTTHDALTNVLLLVLAHAALLAFWAVLCTVPFGLGLLAVLPIACVLHQKAMSEWLHEAAHWNFLPSRVWNDRVIQVLAASLFLDDIEEHRRKHFTHHQRRGFFVAEDLDTAALAVRTRGDVLRGLLRDVTGMTALAAIAERSEVGRARPIARAQRQMRLLLASATAYVSVTLVLALAMPTPIHGAAPAWALGPVYLVTLATLYPVFNRLRVYAQHAEVAASGSIAAGSVASRSILVDRFSLLDRIFVSSKVMLFHAEHHQHPTLPFRQLERLTTPHDEDINRFARSRIALLTRLYRELPRGVDPQGASNHR